MIRVVALGSELAGDDRAALDAVRALAPIEGVELVLAGRPGPSLLDHLEGATVVLVDVVRRGLAPGEIVTMDLAGLGARGLSSGSMTSHDLGPIDALRLAEALGRPTPRGLFVGVGGASFARGAGLGQGVSAALPGLRTAILEAIAAARSAEEKDHA
ncbi:MAG: hydrogenase maturation protease [Sandaracinaceae bacterium]|nr:hydrogenase maturation protease [Sandaracinaceae bacterium]